jgi:four helix bundle protein
MSASYRDLRVADFDETSRKYLQATQDFPKSELYGLVNQMRRAAVSIPSNIAEGKGWLTDRDRAHFFSQARGSLLELEIQILIGEQLKYVSSTSECPGSVVSRGRPYAECSDRFNPPEARNVGTLKRCPRRSLKSEV